jgi:hypothetical protein
MDLHHRVASTGAVVVTAVLAAVASAGCSSGDTAPHGYRDVLARRLPNAVHTGLGEIRN